MAVQTTVFIARSTITPAPITFNSRTTLQNSFNSDVKLKVNRRNFVPMYALGDRSNNSVGGDVNSNMKGKVGSTVPNANYVVPLDDYSSGITRPLAEILRDLNKRIPDSIIVKQRDDTDTRSSFIPWYHANRMLSFYAPGWCGEIRDVIFSDAGSVTVVYRLTVRGSDGEAHRESTGTVLSTTDDQNVDPVAAAEEIAFCKACARFGLGLYLYHED